MLKIMLALERRAGTSDLILVEEPENHLSFSSMNILLTRMQEKCKDKQIVVTTHSAYVLNKLGLNSLILLGSNGVTSSLNSLSSDTQEYFEKLAGYDTLRLVLAKKAILVEGPSDELVVQRAYYDHYGRRPIENGVDVISVRGLSFPRFLDIAVELKKPVRVVTDHDGDPARVDKKYEEYRKRSGVVICRSDDPTTHTLEPALLKENGREIMNQIFGKAYATDEELLSYMAANKTECALRIFKSQIKIAFPKYVIDAIT